MEDARKRNKQDKSKIEDVSPTKRPRRLCSLTENNIRCVPLRVTLKLIKPEQLDEFRTEEDYEEEDDDYVHVVEVIDGRNTETANDNDGASTVLSDNISAANSNTSIEPITRISKDLHRLDFKSLYVSDDKIMLYVEVDYDRWYRYKIHPDRHYYCQICVKHKKRTCAIATKDDEGKDRLYGRDNHGKKCLQSLTDIQEYLLSHPVTNLQSSLSGVMVNLTESIRLPDDRWVLLSENNVMKRYMYIISENDNNLACKYVFKGKTPSNDVIFLCEQCFSENRHVYCQVSYSGNKVIVDMATFENHGESCFNINLLNVMKSEKEALVNTVIPFIH